MYAPMSTIEKSLALVATLAAAALAFAGTASAHVEAVPGKVPAGKPVNLKLEIGHGCDGAATTGLVVKVPKQATDVTAAAVDGWKATTTPTELRWKGGPLPDHDHLALPFRTTLSGRKGDVIEFKTIQKCEGGAETAWIQTSGPGESEAEHPAPVVTLTSTAAAAVPEVQQEADAAANAGEPTATDATAGEDSDPDSDDGSGKTLLLIIVAGLAIGTVAGIIVRARRN